jgi:RHS repeat-associated protein
MAKLGNAQRQPDGSWRFDNKVDGLWLELSPAFAYQQPAKGLPVIDPASAHLTVAKAGAGFDITLSVDSAWLVGKTFPIILDPSLNFSCGSNTGVDYYKPSGCGGCNTITTSGELYAADYTGYSYDLEPGRSFFQFDVSQIPAGSQVTSAELDLMVGGCIQGACTSAYTVELHQLSGSWSSSSTWTQLAAITSSSVLVSYNQPATSATYYNEAFTGTAFTNLLQSWVNNSSLNYGFEAQLQNDTAPGNYNIGGLFYCFRGTWWCLTSGWVPPALRVTYNTVPAAPPTATAFAGDQNATVNWTVPNNGGSAITGYTVLTQDAGGAPVGSPVTSATTSATVPGLSYGLNYRFGVYATNAVGNGPTTWSSYVTVPLPATVTVTAPQSLYARGQLAGYSLAINNPAAIAVAVSGITDSMAPVLSPGGSSITMDSAACTGATSPTCTVNAGGLTIGSFTLAAGQSHTFTYQAIAIGFDRGCAAVSDAITETTSGGALNRSAAISVCDTGLGIEKWWSYIGRGVTSNSSAMVDIANGNLVVQETDATTIQAHGHLSYALQRTYNAQDSGLLTVPNSLGKGWVLSLSQTGTVPSAVGLYIPVGETVSNPRAVTLIDGDGTRHVFQLKSVLTSAIDSTSASSGPLGLLVPQALSLPAGYTNVCVDSTFSAPPGVHLSFWRYVASSTACASLNPGTSQILGYGAVRPDRVRYEFSADGRILDVGDGNADHLRYIYDGSNRIQTVYEPRSCTYPLAATCRSFAFSYPSSLETDVVDPAGRMTKYKFDAATPQHLIEVDNPDGSKENYVYGGCSGASVDQLCQVTDLRNNVSRFTYTAIAGQPGPSGATSVVDRRGNATVLTYLRPPQNADYVTSDQGGERRTFLSIDTSGRVGEIREGLSSDNYLHQAYYTWDASGQTCRQPDNAVDNNLCRLQRKSLASSSTPDEDTTYVFDAEGAQIKKHQANGTAPAIDSTSGFHAQYVEANGTVNGFDDTVAGSGTVNSTGSGSRSDPATIYYLSDMTQALTPRGNAAGTGYAAYLTTYKPDNLSTISAAAAPTTTICSAGAATNNTGHICEVDLPSYDNGAHTTVKRYTYDAFGQKLSYTTPNAMAQTPIGASYTFSYYQDSDLDLTGSVSAGGWLKAETDPTGYFVAFGYNRSGNVARTWDRDSTSASGLSLSAFPGTLASPPTGAAGVAPFKETIYASHSAPWRFATSSKDPVGNLTTYTLDFDGNQLTIRPPRGNAAGNATFDVTQTFDANDNLLTRQMPVEAPAGKKTTYTYNAFNSVASTTDPNGNVVVSTYDTINRPTGTVFTRSAWPADTTTVPPSCRQSTSSDAPIPSGPPGRILCFTTIAYDSLDNVTGTTDANGQTTTITYDGLHRKLVQSVPRFDGPPNLLPTTYVYDGDGNVTDLCPPREVTEGSGVCNSNAQYSQHWTYDRLGRKATLTTYRYGTGFATNTTTYGYDADGNLISTTDPRGSAYAVTDTFDLNDRKLSETKPRVAGTSNTTSWTYSPSGTLVSQTRPGGLITAYSYDADQRPVDTVVGASSTSAASAWPVDTANGGSNIRTRVVYDADGNVIQRYEARAFTTSSAGADLRFMSQTDYDADGRPVKQYVPRYDNADAAFTDQAVDGTPGNPSTGTQFSQCRTGVSPYPTAVGVCVTSVAYDAAGNRITLWLPTSNGTGNRFIAYSYTDDRLVAGNDQPSPTGSGRALTSFLYDANGNLAKTTDPNGWQYTRAYFPDGLLKQTVNQANGSVTHVTSYRYDGNGNKWRVTDPVLNVSAWTYYSDNFLKYFQDNAGDTTAYGPDQVGNMLTVYSPSAMAADATNPTQLPTNNTYTFDNLLQSSTQPITTTQFRRHVYGYDAAGRKTADRTYLVDQNGTVIVDDGNLGYGYYNDDRLAQRWGRFVGNDLISYKYDPAGHTTLATDNTNRPYSTPDMAFTYYLDGSLRTSQDMTFSMASLYSYDGSGNRVGRAEEINNSSGRALTTYTYNDAGKMASMTSVASGPTAVTFLYDRNGNLTQRNDPNQGAVILRYNTDSTLASADLYNNPWYQASWTYGYDGNYRVTSQGFSGLGVQGGVPVQGTASYTYDGGGRISWVTLPGQAAQNVPWDHDGNRLSYQGVTYTYNMDDSIATAGATSFTYFPQGALRTDAGHLYCYDGYDRLLRATTVSDVNCSSPTISYAYEGLDRQRAHSEGSGTTFMEYDGLSSTMSSEFVSGSPGGSGNIYALAGSRRTAVGSYASGGVQSSTINYLADDGRGNIATAVTNGGAMACTARFDPWGVPLSPLSSSNPCNTGSTINTGFYTGSRRDSITGDYQFGVRTYDPSTGSFLQPDTYFGSQPGAHGSVVTDPLTRNRYVYVNGDPLNLIDPGGHDASMLEAGGGGGYVDNNSPASANNYSQPCTANPLDWGNCTVDGQQLSTMASHATNTFLSGVGNLLCSVPPCNAIRDGYQLLNNPSGYMARQEAQSQAGRNSLAKLVDTYDRASRGPLGAIPGAAAAVTALSWATDRIGDFQKDPGNAIGNIAVVDLTLVVTRGIPELAPESESAAGAATTVVGRRGNPIAIQPGTNAPRKVNGVSYKGHAFDQMQGRGIPPSVVKNTIEQGVRSPGYDGASRIYDSVNDVTVILNPDGSVKTVYTGGG